MGDPICKWRNASVWTTIELVSQLPKKKMPNYKFRDIMNDSIYGKAFLRTAYQLACQLGLYYIDEKDMYVPRFNHNITESEAVKYLNHWITRYYVPNPYTARKFDNIPCSVVLMYAISEFVEENPGKNNLEIACDTIFEENTGNLLCVKYILNEYSKIMEIDSDFNIKLIKRTTEDFLIWNERTDKKAFFDYITK